MKAEIYLQKIVINYNTSEHMFFFISKYICSYTVIHYYIYISTKDLKGSNKAININNPKIDIIIPETLLITNKLRRRNFLLKIFITVDKVYHHSDAPRNTPSITNDSVTTVGSEPNIEVPAKAAIKTNTTTGFEAVRKNNDTKSLIKPTFASL